MSIHQTEIILQKAHRLKKVRNAIEHFVYDLTPEKVQDDLVLFLETATSMMVDRADTYFPEHLEDDAMEIYCNLMGEE